jgi:hypothetical protein
VPPAIPSLVEFVPEFMELARAFFVRFIISVWRFCSASTFFFSIFSCSFITLSASSSALRFLLASIFSRCFFSASGSTFLTAGASSLFCARSCSSMGFFTDTACGRAEASSWLAGVMVQSIRIQLRQFRSLQVSLLPEQESMVQKIRKAKELQ